MLSLLAKVKAAALNEPSLKSGEINVETFKGVVLNITTSSSGPERRNLPNRPYGPHRWHRIQPEAFGMLRERREGLLGKQKHPGKVASKRNATATCTQPPNLATAMARRAPKS
jgi:hypothetical protein